MFARESRAFCVPVYSSETWLSDVTGIYKENSPVLRAAL